MGAFEDDLDDQHEEVEEKEMKGARELLERELIWVKIIEFQAFSINAIPIRLREDRSDEKVSILRI